MRIRYISSKANPVLKKFRRASSGSEYALIEGRKLLEDALTAGVRLQCVIAAESAKPELKSLLSRCDEAGANLIFGSDAHEPDQMPTRQQAERVCIGAGLTVDEVQEMFERVEQFVG